MYISVAQVPTTMQTGFFLFYVYLMHVQSLNFNIVFDFVFNNIDDNNNMVVFIYFIKSIIFLNVIMITNISNRN